LLPSYPHFLGTKKIPYGLDFAEFKNSGFFKFFITQASFSPTNRKTRMLTTDRIKKYFGEKVFDRGSS